MFDKIRDWLIGDRIETIVKNAEQRTREEVLEVLGNTVESRSNIIGDDALATGPYSSWASFINKNTEMLESDKLMYQDYDNMDYEVPELSSALDVNADFITYPSNTKNSDIFSVKLKKKGVQKKVDDFINRVHLQQNFYGMVRLALKYGDNYEELIADKDTGEVTEFQHIQTHTVVPNVSNGKLVEGSAYQQVNESGTVVSTLKESEVFHLSVSSDRERWLKYRKGVSVLLYSRFSYKQVSLMEQGMMIARLSRANQHFAIMLDCGTLEPDEALDFIKKYKKQQTRRKYIDPQTGKWSWNYNPLTVAEDMVLPTRAGSNASVISLNNNAGIGKGIEDINYHQDKMIFSTHTPKILIGKEGDINSKATSDIHMTMFLRRIRKFQMMFEPQIKKMIVNAMLAEGVYIKASDITIEWPITNYIDEERRWTIEKLKMEIAGTLSELALVDDLYIYTKLMGMTEEEAKKTMERLDQEQENYENELDDMADNAVDKSDQTAKEFEDDPSGYGDDGDEEVTKEDIMNHMKDKLGDKDFNEFMEMQKKLDSHPKLKSLLSELVTLTQARLYE